ncbi:MULTISPECIES: molybdate ABC transporter substrate-binding protein [unclassified Bradyrhizobium]
MILINSILTLLMAGNAGAAEVDVAVAANFTAPAKELQRRLSRRPGEALLRFGASGQLYNQMTQGAPFGVFLGPTRPPEQSGRERSCVPECRFTDATCNLVLWSSAPKFVNDAEAFAKPSIHNPAAARYGAATKHAVKALGACELMQPKLVAGSSHLSGPEAPSPSPLPQSWADTSSLSWSSRSGRPPLPSWLAAGMVMFGLAVILTATLIEKCSARNAREDSHTRPDRSHLHDRLR